MIKKYAIVSTNLYVDGEWKSFYLVQTNLTEEDILKIKFYYDEHNRLWEECYAQERENAKNGIAKDLRTDLIYFLKKQISENDYNSIENYYETWLKKDLIIEHYEI